MPETKETRDLLIEVKTKVDIINESLRAFDKIIVPRTEFMVIIEELRAKDNLNQRDIKDVQDQVRNMMYKLGVGLGSLNIVTALAMYLLTK